MVICRSRDSTNDNYNFKLKFWNLNIINILGW